MIHSYLKKSGSLTFLILLLLIICNPARANSIDAKSFTTWWTSFKDTPSVPPELKKMEDHFVSSELLNRCSLFWLALNKMNIEQITQHGYENFKQTVACNYFTWVVDKSHIYAKNLYTPNSTSLLKAFSSTELSKKHPYFTSEQSYQYNCTTALFYDYLMKNGAGPYLALLDEPFFGNPPSISINGKSISQDVLNSLLEYLSIATQCDMSTVSTILELGAGSGRTAYCFLKLKPNVKYIVVDIPPALFLSQTYLSQVFSDRKVFTFRPFQDFEEIKQEFLASDIVFLTPDQMLKLPSGSVDLFMAIDCLHEMKKQEVQAYFNEANRLASLFYFKCWNETVVPYDNVSHTIHSYPVKPSWKKIFEGNCFVPSTFFHALYALK